jgi:hypothetical protein
MVTSRCDVVPRPRQSSETTSVWETAMVAQILATSRSDSDRYSGE